jgi:hypothetical protein
MTAFSLAELRTFHFDRISDVSYPIIIQSFQDEPPSLSDTDDSPETMSVPDEEEEEDHFAHWCRR